MNEDVTLICRADELGAAEALVAQYPGGAGTFSVKLCAQNAADPTVATFYAGSGLLPAELTAACRQSIRPTVLVFSNTGTTFDAIIAATTISDLGKAAVGLKRCPSTVIVSRRQAELALYYDGVLDVVEAAVAQASKDVQISYARASEFRRDDAMLNSVCANILHWNTAQIDALFALAKSIPN